MSEGIGKTYKFNRLLLKKIHDNSDKWTYRPWCAHTRARPRYENSKLIGVNIFELFYA